LFESIECSIYRGGTSRALMLDEMLLPPPGEVRDKILISLIGGPDPKQIDGLGGGVVTTSKVALIKKSSLPGVDVDYTFGQVVIGQNVVDYRANCGNISSAVGPYAIDRGLVRARDGITPVTIYNTNTEKTIIALVETSGGKTVYDGDFAISGVQGTGSKIELKFLRPDGAATGKLLPTGNAKDELNIPGLGKIAVSVVDASNLFVFVDAARLGLAGNELPDVIDAQSDTCSYFESIRGMIAQRLGYVDDYRQSFEKTPAVPKIAAVSAPAGYTAVSGIGYSPPDMDLHVRMISMKKTHKTFAMTGGMCIAAAAAIPGTVVNDIVRKNPHFDTAKITLAHPGGLMDVGVDAAIHGAGVEILSASGFRTARRLMDGLAYYHV
jgi:2-methylaconitate cis-trans-isomerase PrpF